ncbi:MAG TPA: 30S ribosome-binding factor RbfA [Blastocatellia bacterium]|nr:30S ribosome-binding factor RbfA [Blastocatellia bacterium]
MPGRRPERLGEQIREEVSQIILGELSDPRIGFVTVTDVEVSSDLRNARIYVSILGGDDEVARSLGALRAASGFIRWHLGRALNLRHLPDLHFAHDKTARTATRIEEILKEEGVKAQSREGDDAPLGSSHPPATGDPDR